MPQHDTDALRRDNPLHEVVARYVKVIRDGEDYKACCPFHAERTPSFVAYADGHYHCFGCGAHGADVIDFVMRIEGVEFVEACERLGAAPRRSTIDAPKGQPSAESILEPVECSEDDLPRAGDVLTLWNGKRKSWPSWRPAAVYPYRTSEGRILGAVIRVDTAKGHKITPQIRLARFKTAIIDDKQIHHEAGTIAWALWSFDRPRPLYGLEYLDTDGEVWVVEGEKKADFVRELGYQAVAWPGGANGHGHVDWTPLRGRDLLMWPDNDAPGWACMFGRDDEHGRHHPGVVELAQPGRVRFIPPDPDQPKGWDVADMPPDQVAAHVERRVKVYEAVENEEAPAEAAPEEQDGPLDAPEPPGVPEEFEQAPPPPGPDGDPSSPTDRTGPGFINGFPFRCLGHNRGMYFYLPNGTQQLVELQASAHSPPALISLAPLAHWEEHFQASGKGAKFDLQAAQNALMREAEAVGIFVPDRLRGRGAWIDKGRPIVHLGPRVYVGRDEFQPHAVPSDYIYEAAEPLRIERAAPATSGEANELVKICNALSWDNDLSAQLLAGWCVLAPICGALEHRPHIWVTGPSTAGKTTVIKHIVGRVVGPFALQRDGTTTEAHLRQSLFHDARPVILDEAENDDKVAATRMRALLELSRISSDGGTVGKGGKDGQAVEYTVRACFCYSSINVAINNYADESRISRLLLKKREAKNETDVLKNEVHFKELNANINKTLTPRFAARMFARSIEYMPVLLENVRVFVDACAYIIGSRRAANQIGTLLAGLHLCYSTKPIKYDAAVKWVREHKWGDHTAIDTVLDENRMLERIMAITRQLTTAKGIRKLTVGELLEIDTYGVTVNDVGSDDAKKELGRVGIKTDLRPGKPPYFVIANDSSELKRLLSDTPWASNWKQTLKTLGGEPTASSEYFGPGLHQRGVRLPLALIQGG